jgi:hypothetical protein
MSRAGADSLSLDEPTLELHALGIAQPQLDRERLDAGEGFADREPPGRRALVAEVHAVTG